MICKTLHKNEPKCNGELVAVFVSKPTEAQYCVLQRRCTQAHHAEYILYKYVFYEGCSN